MMKIHAAAAVGAALLLASCASSPAPTKSALDFLPPNSGAFIADGQVGTTLSSQFKHRDLNHTAFIAGTWPTQPQKAVFGIGTWHNLAAELAEKFGPLCKARGGDFVPSPCTEHSRVGLGGPTLACSGQGVSYAGYVCTSAADPLTPVFFAGFSYTSTANRMQFLVAEPKDKDGAQVLMFAAGLAGMRDEVQTQAKAPAPSPSAPASTFDKALSNPQ